jgi:hypothetical protein
MLNELSEVPNCVLDMRVCAFLNKYPEMIEYLLISDQYVGYKIQAGEEQSNATNGNSNASTDAPTNVQTSNTYIGLNKSRPILILCLNVPGKGNF